MIIKVKHESRNAFVEFRDLNIVTSVISFGNII